MWTFWQILYFFAVPLSACLMGTVFIRTLSEDDISDSTKIRLVIGLVIRKKPFECPERELGDEKGPASVEAESMVAFIDGISKGKSLCI